MIHFRSNEVSLNDDHGSQVRNPNCLERRRGHGQADELCPRFFRNFGAQLVRSFSSSSPALKQVKPPVTVFGTEGRYAMALYSAASKEKALDAVEKDLVKFQAQLAKDNTLNEFLFDPSVKKNIKADGLSGACDKLGMNKLSKNLFLVMADNGRYSHFGSVVNSFKTIMAAHRGEVVCEVTTAKASLDVSIRDFREYFQNELCMQMNA